MLRATLIYAIFMAGFSTLAQSYSPPTAGLVGWWRGEGNANDSRGGHNASSSTVGYTNGVFGQAFACGSGKGIYIPDSPDFRLTNFTIAAWVNVHADSWTLFSRMSAAFIPYSIAGNLDGTLHLYINTQGGTPQDSITTAIISNNQWHHIAGTMDSTAGKMALFLDGNLVAQKSTTVVPVLDISPVGATGIGIGNALNHEFPLLGDMDEVLLYSRALSSNEISSLVNPFCSPHRAAATAQVVNGFVVGATITDPGCGYTNPPAVAILGGGGNGATATAVVSNGVVAGLVITSAGVGYTNAPRILIGSPLFEPWLEIAVSAVKVTLHVVLGRNYVLESSTNLQTWTQVGAPFTAQDEVITQEFEIDVTGRFFRIRQVP